MHNRNKQIACDLCVHECDGKIPIYNFNIRRNIAQQKKKERKRQNEYRMCKRKENKGVDRQIERKNFFSL
jgi:hypothetical protein